MLEILIMVIVVSSFTTLIYLNVLVLNSIKNFLMARILKKKMQTVLAEKKNKEVLEKDDNGIHNLDKWIQQNKEEGRNVGINSHRSESSSGS